MTYVTERCVMKLRPEGLVVTEVAPGIDVERDIRRQAQTPLHIADDLRPMAPGLFRPEPIGLDLSRPRP